MDLSAQLNKLRILNNALSAPSDYLTRVVTDDDNAPFLAAGDLVAFALSPIHLTNIDDGIFLFIYNDAERIGYLKNNQVTTLNSVYPINGCLAVHRLLFISK